MKSIGKKYSVSKNERDLLISQINDLISKEKIILFAYLHGSFAEEDTFRDIDLAVFLTDIGKQKGLECELKLEEKLESILKLPVDLKVLNDAPPTFAYMVIKKGIKLSVRDDRERVAFEMQTLKKYFDFLPFRRRYLQEA